MTCVIGCLTNHGMYMGGDGRSTNDCGDIVCDNAVKVFRRGSGSGAVLAGVSGSKGLANILEHGTWPVLEWTDSGAAWLHNTMVPWIREQRSRREDTTGATLLFAIRGSLHCVYNDMSHGRICYHHEGDSFDGSWFKAIGSGADYATGYLDALRFLPHWKAEEVLGHMREVMAAVAKRDARVNATVNMECVEW